MELPRYHFLKNLLTCMMLINMSYNSATCLAAALIRP